MKALRQLPASYMQNMHNLMLRTGVPGVPTLPGNAV
jgi:hypothetical protein